jgi:hypothetical protein
MALTLDAELNLLYTEFWQSTTAKTQNRIIIHFCIAQKYI